MNKIFKVVWNKARNCYVVVSEVAKANGKSSVKSIAAVAAAAVLMSGGTAFAAPGSITIDSIYPDEQIDVEYSASEQMTVEYSVYDKYGSTIYLESGGDTSVGSVYAKSKSDIDIISAGNTTIKGSVDSSGYGGTITIDSGEQTTIAGSVNITNPNKYGGGNAGGDTINVGGKNISVGSGVLVTGRYYGFGKETAVNLGTADTELVNVESSQIGLWSQYTDSDINVYGKELNIEVSGENAYSGIYTGNNSEAHTPSAEVNVYSDHTKINMVEGAPAIVALSQSAVNIHGGLETTGSQEAIYARGNSSVNVNTSGEGVVKLNGDIVLGSQGTDKFVAAQNNINVNMTTADSYLNGKIYVSNESGSTQTYEDVSGMKLGMSNGATWNVTGDSFVNNLYGTDGKLVNASDGEVEVVVYNREDEAGVAVGNSELNVEGVDLVIDTEKTAIYNQDLTIKSDSDVTIKSQQQGISAYGDVTIEAENVTIESVDNGIQSVADANPNDVGNVTIKANDKVSITASTEGYAVTNVSKNGGVINIEGKDVTLVSENRTAVKVGHEVGETGYNGTLNVTGETITIEGAAKEAKEGAYRQSAAVFAQGGETELNLNATEAIAIKNTGSTKGSAIGAYDGGKVAVDAGEGTVDVDGQVTVAVGSEVTVNGADVTVNSVEDALDTWGGNIEITADNSIDINSSEKDGVQANDATVTLDAKEVNIDAAKWGINNIAENDSSVVINAEDVVIAGDEGAIRTLNNGNGVVTVNAAGTTKVMGDIFAEGNGKVTVGFKGEESVLAGNVTTNGNAETNLSFADGATWTVDGVSVVSNLEMNGGNLDIENAVADAVTIGELTGTAMNVNIDNFVEGTVVVDTEKADGMKVSVSTSQQINGMEAAKAAQNVVKFDGVDGVDVVEAQDNYIVGDVTYDLENGKVTTTLDTDLNVTGTINGVDITNAGGLDRNAASQYYQTTTIEGKTTIDSMGRVYTNHVFADQAIVVGDHSTLDSTGLYVGEGFKVDRETGNVTAGTINGAEISEYKVNGVVLDKDGDVFAKDIMATGGVTSVGNITAIQGLKAASGKFSVDANTGDVTGGLYNGVNVENLKDQVDANIDRIENVENRVTENEFAISQNEKDIAANAEKIETNNKLIAENRDAIADNAFDIETNKAAIEANKDAIAGNADAIADNKAAIEANKDAIADNAAAIEANKNAIEANKDAIASNKQAIADEAAAREAADKALSDAIDNAVGDLADTKAQVEQNKADIADNKAAIADNAQAITNEAANRVAADNKLQAAINKEAVDRQIEVAKERADRAAEDAKLQSQVDENKANIAGNKAAIDKNATDIATNAAGIQQNTNAIAGLNNRVTSLDGRVDKVGAGAAALAALHPLDYDSENKLSFSAGVGNYAGQTAAAVGAFYRPNEDVMFSIGGTAGNGENMVNAGVSFAIGKGSSGVAKMSKAELVQEVTNMKAENEELKQENKDIRNELNKLKELVMKLAEK